MKAVLPQRRLIPKWRPIATTLKTSEASSISKKKPASFSDEDIDLEFENALLNWKQSPTTGMLGELLSFSVHNQFRERLESVIREVITKELPSSLIQRELLSSDLSTPRLTDSSSDNHFIQNHMQRLRQLLRTAPDNPLALLDYAQLQLAVGKSEQAKRSLLTAQQLAPNNRIVIRTLARFYVHIREEDRAHAYIKRHQRTQVDPWLQATEIALADLSNSQSNFISKGKRLLSDKGKFSPEHISELAGAIAHADIITGNLKKARESQRLALIAPNDNVIAQAIDMEKSFGLQLESPKILAAMENSNEALVLKAWRALSPKDVEYYAKLWHTEEPFSSRPIQLLTSLYSHRKQYEEARKWINMGLLSDPRDTGLLISLAYNQARLGRFSDAEQTIRKYCTIDPIKCQPFSLATRGLIAYAHANFELGDKLYAEAMQLFEKRNEKGVAIYCLMNQTFAAIDYSHPDLDKRISIMNEMLKSYPDMDAVMMLVVRNNEMIATPEIEEVEQRLLRQWIYDPASNSLTEKTGITSKGAPILILNK